MFTFLALSVLTLVAVAVFGAAVLLVKLALLPLRLAFGLVKLVCAFAAGAVLLLVGLPALLIVIIPALAVTFLVWGTLRLLAT